MKSIWVAFADDGQFACVSNSGTRNKNVGDRSVTQIKIGQGEDPDEVISTVVMEGSPYGLVLCTDGKKLYAVTKTYGAKNASTTIYVIDTETKAVIKDVEVSEQPDHLFLRSDGSEARVTENRGNKISIIDVASDTVTGTIVMPGDSQTVRFGRF